MKSMPSFKIREISRKAIWVRMSRWGQGWNEDVRYSGNLYLTGCYQNNAFYR
jgi:hypothetical protein